MLDVRGEGRAKKLALAIASVPEYRLRVIDLVWELATKGELDISKAITRQIEIEQAIQQSLAYRDRVHRLALACMNSNRHRRDQADDANNDVDDDLPDVD